MLNRSVPSALLSAVLRLRYRQLLKNQQGPFQQQKKAYLRLRRALQGTHIAELARLKEFTDFSSFLEGSSLIPYERYHSLIERTLQDRQEGLLFHGIPKFVGLSSGTTGHNSKQIIYDDRMLRAFQSFQLSFASVIQRHTEARPFSDMRITWGSTPFVDRTMHGIDRGYVSGYLATRSPGFLRKLNFPSIETCRMPNMAERVLETARQTRNRDIRVLLGVPTYLIYLLEELRAHWKVKQLSEVWPNLKTIIYSGTSAEHYRSQFHKLIGYPVQFLGTYISTEGPLGYEIPALNGGRNGIYAFHYGEIVYTFRRLSGGRQSERLLSVVDLRQGDEVELFISSPNGMINYRIGDCLKIHSTDPLLFEVIGRVGHGLNISGEKASLSQLDRVIASISASSSTPIRHFFVYPGQSSTGRPCYEWVLLVDDPERINTAELGNALDRTLMEVNGDYQLIRQTLRFLEPPAVRVTESSLARKYFERDSHRGQLKMKTAFDSKEKYLQFMDGLGADGLGVRPEV